MGRWKYRSKTDKWTRLAGSWFNRNACAENPFSASVKILCKQGLAKSGNKGHGQIQEPDLTSVMQKFNLFQSPGSIVR